MWNLFKLTNLFWLLTSTYIWVFAQVNKGPILVVVNAILIVCLSFLPIKFRFDRKLGIQLVIMALIGLWYLWIEGPLAGFTTFLMCLPVILLIQLPFEYKKDLLRFCTKWYALMLIPSFLIYVITLFIQLPSFGLYIHPPYPPFSNYIFYLKTTFDYGIFVRFNAFFLEPGHQALLSTFLMIANRFRFKEMPWLWVLLICVIFSFSLAGYLLTFVGFALLKIDSVPKALIVAGITATFVAGTIAWSGGDNTLNELIISRLEYDEASGIKGNNRFYNNTDYEFGRIIGTKYFWTGVQGKVNMDLIGGAGFKIYILQLGMVGTLLALIFYISLIPDKPDYRFTIGFLLVLVLCFFQRAYPYWYSWLFPYVIGMYVAKGEKDRHLLEQGEIPSF